MKHVRVNLHVISLPDGTGNFSQSNSQHLAYLYSIFNESFYKSVNAIYSEIPYYIHDGVVYDQFHLGDSRIRFSLENVIFHTDNGGLIQVNETDHATIMNYCMLNYGISIETHVNMFFLPTGIHPDDSNNQHVGGYGPADFDDSGDFIGAIFMANIYRNFLTYPDQNYPYGGKPSTVNQIIAHEFGHVFGLRHTNNYSLSYLRFYPELKWPET